MTTNTLYSEPSIAQAFGGEVLQPSALSAFDWPDRDPRAIDQTIAPRSAEDERLVDTVSDPRFDLAGFRRRTASLPLPERILALLAHARFNFNGVQRVTAEPEWLERVRRKVAAGEPIEIVYLWGCKIGNAAKLFDAHLPTFAELASLRFMARLADLVREFYAPGARIKLITDTVFYNTALGNPPPEVCAYRNALIGMTARPEIAGRIEVYDYAEMLADDVREYCAHYDQAYRLLDRERDRAIEPGHWQRLFQSTRAVINTRHLGMDYATLRAVFGKDPDPAHPMVRRVDAMAEEALKIQLAIKAAADDMRFLERWSPDHIRASCHKGLKHGRAVIGLRPYPEYYGASKLLPYHGAALVTGEGKRRRMLILPEICLRGREDLVRVTDEAGATWYYRG